MIKDKQIQINTSFSLFRLIERLILIGIVIFLWNLYSGEKDALKEKENLIEAANAKLETWVDKDGRNMAKIAVLETANTKTLLSLESTNETINDLQTLVKRNGRLLKKQGSASVIKAETKIDTFANTIVTVDTNNSPIYTASLTNPWYSIKSVASKDTTKYELSTFSKLNLTIGRERQGLFKKSKPYAMANDENPYTNIKDMRVYQVSLPKTKRLGMSIYGGYGATYIPQALPGNKLQSGWQLGVGTSYTIFYIK